MARSQYQYDLSAFRKPLSDEALYWCGLLATDGSIYKNKIALGLSGVDEEHVYDFRNYVGGGAIWISPPKDKVVIMGVSTRKQEDTRVNVCCKELVQDLAKLGIVPKKSLTLQVDSELAASSHFWRGAFDGDGCLLASRCQMSFYSSSKSFLDQYLNFLESLGISSYAKLSTGRCNPHWHVDICGDKVILLAQALYSDSAEPALPRKKALAKSWLSKREAA